MASLVFTVLIGLAPGRAHAAVAPRILIVADEIPAMEVLAAQLRRRVRATSTIVTQDKLPGALAAFSAVVVYIHNDLAEPAEKALIAYAESGGRLILLHHSISSAKRKNKLWFPFLGVTLPTGDVEAGGYKFYDDVDFELVNRAPQHPVTTRAVKYPRKQKYGDPVVLRPSFPVPQTEVYVNHVLQGERTILFGLHWADPKSGKIYQQDIAGWRRRTGRGETYYFMPGHKAADFENPPYAQALANAVSAPRPK